MQPIQHVYSQLRMCSIAQKYHLMKGTLDVAVAIVTRHVYTEAEMESSVCEWGCRSWVDYWNCITSAPLFALDFLLDLFCAGMICVQML